MGIYPVITGQCKVRTGYLIKPLSYKSLGNFTRGILAVPDFLLGEFLLGEFLLSFVKNCNPFL